jgi:hypothetical protein
MNVLTVTAMFGELNSVMLNQLELDGLGGEAELVMDSMGLGEAFAPLLIVGFPSINPRVCIPAESNVAKVSSCL